jgi:hypothetical protein
VAACPELCGREEWCDSGDHWAGKATLKRGAPGSARVVPDRLNAAFRSAQRESYKNVVKLTFAKGASLKDPARLFNSSIDGNVRRAIDIHEGEEVDESAFKALVRHAVALNSSSKSKPSKKAH